MKGFCSDALVLLVNQMNDEELRVLKTDLECRVIKINRIQAIGTYSIRARLHENDRALSEQFKSLLKTLEEITVEFVIIHAVVVKRKLYLFFTNESNSLLYGYLIFSETDSRNAEYKESSSKYE